MKPVKIAMMSLTHGHTRKYYQTLRDNPKLDWVAVSTANEEVKKIITSYKNMVVSSGGMDKIYFKNGETPIDVEEIKNIRKAVFETNAQSCEIWNQING